MKWLKTGLVLIAAIVPYLYAQPVSLSITNNDLALVQDMRTLSVEEGANIITISDLPEYLDPSSLIVSFSRKSIKLNEQNYYTNTLNAQNILNRAIGSEVRIIHPELGNLVGRLLSADQNTLVLETDDKKIRILSDYAGGQIIVDDSLLPDSPPIQPSLEWLIDSDISSTVTVTLSYLTGGLSWQAEYAAVLSESENEMTLSSWITVENNSGLAYKQVKLLLLAGDIHRVSATPRQTSGQILMAMEKQTGAEFESGDVFEYHSYQLGSKVTLKSGIEKQLTFFPSRQITIAKSFNYNYQKDPENVGVVINAQNTQDNGLGFPLPMGRVRIYKKTDEQQLILGEDNIGHIPGEEDLKIMVGKAFDIKAERTIIERIREGKNSEKSKIAIEFRNHKKEDIEILVTEPIPRHRESRIVSSNYKVYRKLADFVEFKIPVNAGNSARLTYEILYTW